MKHKLTVTEHIRKTHEIEVKGDYTADELDVALDYAQDTADDMDEYKQMLSENGINTVNHREIIDCHSIECDYADEI
ncbi:hypothetical protein [Peptostreptococcus equinus]|uniref:Uncharacterized protein n=1 Tax=Peptostreptococcus equinus TaxID=3003601 RepID=A0ABY7JMP5_9FIRM|nr:hypothetical protein [Peptostreptococcus sp. CBA3647]WAW14635.1 hypothetical protein O0R46_08530 [Peptostreptococcus sp. CBA3647]